MIKDNNFLEPAFASNLPLYNVQLQCTGNSSLTVSVPVMSVEKPKGKLIILDIFLNFPLMGWLDWLEITNLYNSMLSSS